MAAAAAAACLCSCEEKLENLPANADEKTCVDLTVCVPCEVSTKSTATNDEKKVNNLQIYVFDDGGLQIEAYAKGEGSSLTAKVALGRKTVAALVNAPECVGCYTLAELKAYASDLNENTPSNFVMFGYDSVDVQASTTVSVNVNRLAARVVIGKITNAIDVEQYKNEAISLNKIYLINAGGVTTLGNGGFMDISRYYFKRGITSTSGNIPSLLLKTYNAQSISKGASYTASASLYCYPNIATSDSNSETWSARYTRLVVETTIAGKTWYYPITIDQEIKSNTSYEIPELKITRLGSTSPDVPLVIGDAQFTVNVEEWVESILPTVEI